MNYKGLGTIDNDLVHVEIGCGNNKREMKGYKSVGVDLVDGPCVDKVCNLGFDDIPLPADYADFVQGIDFIEHVPKCVWENEKRLLPLTHVMNEIWRIMKNNAELYLETPFSPWAYNRDPTHVSWLAEDWYNYFKKDDNLYYDQGLVTCDFKIKESNFKPYKNPNDTLCTRLIAIKG